MTSDTTAQQQRYDELASQIPDDAKILGGYHSEQHTSITFYVDGEDSNRSAHKNYPESIPYALGEFFFRGERFANFI